MISWLSRAEGKEYLKALLWALDTAVLKETSVLSHLFITFQIEFVPGYLELEQEIHWMVLQRDTVLLLLGTGLAGHGSDIPPGSGQAATAAMWQASSPCREASHGKECCFLGLVSLCPCMAASPLITHLSVHDVGPQGGLCQVAGEKVGSRRASRVAWASSCACSSTNCNAVSGRWETGKQGQILKNNFTSEMLKDGVI